MGPVTAGATMGWVRRMPSVALARLPGRPAVWLAVGLVMTVALRAPYLNAALTRDEGGDTFIAQAFHHGGPFAYGAYFLDRPPLLLALYRVAADLAGDSGVRMLGLLAAMVLVGLIVALATRLGGSHAAPFAALAGAAMVSSQATGGVESSAELLAAVPSSASVLLLVAALQNPRGARRLLAASGAAAAAAILVKQSFGDALVAGVVGLAVVALSRPSDRRAVLGWAAAYVAGFTAVMAGLVLWAALADVTAHQLWYAMFGFRLDAASVLAHGQLRRALRLGGPLVHSGLAVALLITAGALLRGRCPAGTRAALAGWLLAGVAGVLLGGSYVPTYVIEIVPVAAVGLAVACALKPRLGALALGAVLGFALLPTVRAALLDHPDTYRQDVRAIGHYVRDRAEAGQTVYVMFARANVLYYAGLRSPFPYHWALMMRTVAGATRQLRTLLDGPGRPSWVVDQDGPDGYSLDPRGELRRVLARRYRGVGRVCGTAILLARGAVARPPPQVPESCGHG